MHEIKSNASAIWRWEARMRELFSIWHKTTARAVCCTLAIMSAALTWPAQAQTNEPFYKGKTINLIVPFTAGGLNDIAARLVARHMGAYIPGVPTIIVQNQPSAGGLALANRFANSIERDGLTIAIMGRALPQFAIMGDPNAKFDPLKLTWFGSLSSYENDAYFLLINSSSSIQNLDELSHSPKKLVLGANRTGSTNVTFALIAKDILGLNVEVVRGFPGAADISLAMQRNEVDGQTIDLSAVVSGQRELWEKGAFRPLIQFGRKTRLPQYKNVPTARELTHDPKTLALIEFAELPFFMAMPFAGPPDMPADRTHALQQAFMTMTRNQAFLDDAKKIGIEVSPIDGDAILALITQASHTPRDVLDQFQKLNGE
jgi:tripartite-type tricarboxylate transporter receptor subunit TctC